MYYSSDFYKTLLTFFPPDLFVFRAKTPELLPEPEEEAKFDFEDVRLDSGKFIKIPSMLRCKKSFDSR